MTIFFQKNDSCSTFIGPWTLAIKERPCRVGFKLYYTLPPLKFISSFSPMASSRSFFSPRSINSTNGFSTTNHTGSGSHKLSIYQQQRLLLEMQQRNTMVEKEHLRQPRSLAPTISTKVWMHFHHISLCRNIPMLKIYWIGHFFFSLCRMFRITTLPMWVQHIGSHLWCRNRMP